ncbi:hypothetical protein QUB63_30135 [Microcoleus sp. ARI1-B5]
MRTNKLHLALDAYLARFEHNWLTATVPSLQVSSIDGLKLL